MEFKMNLSCNLLGILYLLFVYFNTVNGAMIQQLVLQNGDNNESTVFTENVPDASIYNFENVTRICALGPWAVFDSMNYIGRLGLYGYLDDTEMACYDESFPKEYKSFRHYGAGNTNLNSLSLFEHPDYEGQEYFFVNDTTAFSGISFSVRSLILTGGANWTLWEGQNFDGNSSCLEGVEVGGWYDFVWRNPFYDPLIETVGSGRLGCVAK